MGKEKTDPQSPEEMAKAMQEAAIKAAMEQAQAMLGNLSGFQMPEGMQEQMMSQMTAGVDANMTELQAQQEAMMKAAGIDTSKVEEASQQNMSFAQQMMQEVMDGTLEEKMTPTADAMAEWMQSMQDLGDDEWSINRSGDGKLNAEQLRLLAFGAPLMVYNNENVDTIDSETDIDNLKSMLQSWWDVTDRASTLDIVKWLLEDGHHAEADHALAIIRERGLENISTEERNEADNKMGDVCLIAEYILGNDWCDGQLPQTIIAWDLVRVVNLAHWAYLCSYIAEEEMWQIMQIAADTALKNFSSWKEYGESFFMGRGVWHVDTDDSDTAHEIITVLLENDESPWKQLSWK